MRTEFGIYCLVAIDGCSDILLIGTNGHPSGFLVLVFVVDVHVDVYSTVLLDLFTALRGDEEEGDPVARADFGFGSFRQFFSTRENDAFAFPADGGFTLVAVEPFGDGLITVGAFHVLSRM
jgi:hypothetical protein